MFSLRNLESRLTCITHFNGLLGFKMPFTDKDMPCVRAIHSCAKCNRPFRGNDCKESYIKHLEHSSKHKISKTSVPESCGQCGRSFSSTRALIQHLKNSRHHLKDLHHAACTGKFQLKEQNVQQLVILSNFEFTLVTLKVIFLLVLK